MEIQFRQDPDPRPWRYRFYSCFSYVKKLQEKGELTHLKGLLYFTDGDGIYPSAPPPYETAFVFTDFSFLKYQVPLSQNSAWTQTRPEMRFFNMNIKDAKDEIRRTLRRLYRPRNLSDPQGPPAPAFFSLARPGSAKQPLSNRLPGNVAPVFSPIR